MIHLLKSRSTVLRRLFAAASACLLIISQCACTGKTAQEAQRLSRGEDWLLNTHCSITVYEPAREDTVREAFSFARDMENLLSRTAASSDISRFNDSLYGADVSDETAEVVAASIEMWESTGGLFDPAIEPLSALWDFSAAEPSAPSAEQIAEVLGGKGSCGGIYFEPGEGGVFMGKTDSRIRLDLGASAKGYIADRVCAFLEERGVASAVVNLGGNVCLVGSKPGGSEWNIGIESPSEGGSAAPIQDRALAGAVRVKGGSVVTSGTYERCFSEGGTVYHHVIDPFTGYPRDTDLVSATVMGESSMMCDMLSTSCLLLGSEEALRLIEGREGFEAVLIKRDGEMICTSGADFSAAD